MTALTACWEIENTAMKKRYYPQRDSSKEFIMVDGELTKINTSQRWFWSEEWQTRHKKAMLEFENGEYVEFGDGEEFLNSLDNL